MRLKEPKTGHELIEEKASDIIQKNAEVTSTLKILDRYAEETPGVMDDDILWAIRHAYRTIESAIEDAGTISDTSEEMRRAGRA